LAIAIVATLTGTSLSVEPYETLDAIAEKLDFSMISHGPARFDPAELDTLNARMLHTMSYAEAAPACRPWAWKVKPPGCCCAKIWCGSQILPSGQSC
jgi:hypothetical protein